MTAALEHQGLGGGASVPLADAKQMDKRELFVQHTWIRRFG